MAICKGETSIVQYITSIEASVILPCNGPSHFPNHDVFLLASFLAACYCISSAINPSKPYFLVHAIPSQLSSASRNTLRLPCFESANRSYEIYTYPLLLTIPIRPIPTIVSASRSTYISDARTHWKKSVHIALSPPLRLRHRMLLSAASWHGSKYSLYALLHSYSNQPLHLKFLSLCATLWTVDVGSKACDWESVERRHTFRI